MADELKCLNTASKAAGFSFCRCWLRAEEVGMEEASNPQKSSISTFVDEDEKRNKFLRRNLSIPLKINIRMNGIIRDIRTNMFYR